MAMDRKKTYHSISRFSMACCSLLTTGLLASEAKILSAPSADIAKTKIASDLPGPDLFQLFSGFIVVIISIVVVLWLLKRLGKMNTTANNQIKVIGGVSLGAREKLVLVEVGSEQIILGVAPGSVRTLHVLKEKIEVEPVNENFGSILGDKVKQMLKRGEDQ